MTKFFLLDLILFLIIGGVAIILQYHFGNRINKKFEIVYGCISAGIIAVTTIVFTIKMNPIITPSLHADYLKLNEEIKYTSIELCENYRDCTLKIVANGFRWGYQTYYSGDANVEIYNSKNERLNYYYKAKVYYNIDVNSVIVLKDANDAKVYIFHGGGATQSIKIEPPNPFGQSHAIHCSEPLNPRRATSNYEMALFIVRLLNNPLLFKRIV